MGAEWPIHSPGLTLSPPPFSEPFHITIITTNNALSITIYDIHIHTHTHTQSLLRDPPRDGARGYVLQCVPRQAPGQSAIPARADRQEALGHRHGLPSGGGEAYPVRTFMSGVMVLILLMYSCTHVLVLLILKGVRDMVTHVTVLPCFQHSFTPPLSPPPFMAQPNYITPLAHTTPLCEHTCNRCCPKHRTSCC